MGVILVESSKQYDQLIGYPNAVVLFSALWVEQCKQMLDVMNTLAVTHTNVQFLNVPAEEFSDVALQCQIEAVPTVIFFQHGRAVARIDGADVAGLTQKCKELSGESVQLESRLKALINRSKVMIFMKGDRNTPRCGFSKQLIVLINETRVEYDTFDILTDETVRQGLKTFSDWPTYPQVYVKGELIGGLDIIKELQQNGELISTLNG